MDQRTITFTCEKCGTKQERVLTWQPSTRPVNPTAGQQDRAQVACEKCGHRQTVPVPK
jgi:hypothetical protein